MSRLKKLARYPTRSTFLRELLGVPMHLLFDRVDQRVPKTHETVMALPTGLLHITSKSNRDLLNYHEIYSVLTIGIICSTH
jgi:hypothetical protein